MVVKLLVDPHTKRIVYAAPNGVTPERILILDAGRQHLFSPATCEHAIYSGPSPAGFNPQKCWDFSYGENGIEPVRAPASAQRVPERA
ncbi:MAG TPA: hypothetical protein VGJ74_06115 [Burkholderiales bacterium]|jgi:hypothetical protein